MVPLLAAGGRRTFPPKKAKQNLAAEGQGGPRAAPGLSPGSVGQDPARGRSRQPLAAHPELDRGRRGGGDGAGSSLGAGGAAQRGPGMCPPPPKILPVVGRGSFQAPLHPPRTDLASRTEAPTSEQPFWGQAPPPPSPAFSTEASPTPGCRVGDMGGAGEGGSSAMHDVGAITGVLLGCSAPNPAPSSPPPPGHSSAFPSLLLLACLVLCLNPPQWI